MRRTIILPLMLTCACFRAEVDEPISTTPLCTVVRTDIVSGAVTDRFEFNGAGLVSHEWHLSPHSYGRRVNRYEDYRLVAATADIHHGAKDDSTYAAWQSRWVVHDVDYDERQELSFGYDDEGRLVRWETRASAVWADETYSSVRGQVRRYDEFGRKAEAVETYSNSRGQKSAVIRRYVYDLDGDDLVDRIVTENKTAHASNSYTVRFAYDSHGRVLGYATRDNAFPKVNAYDERGRMTSPGSGFYRWNDDDQIVERGVGVRLRFEYRDGRQHRAQMDDGGGYVQTYSASCPVGMTHPLITPNTLYHEHYEGPAEHHTWSSY